MRTPQLSAIAVVLISCACGYGAEATFDWPDRRPIGAIFLATSGKEWPKNPRGYFNDPEMDVATDAGKALLRQRMTKLAQDTAAHVKDVGGQGIIVWDIEGGEMPHAVTYLGDPRILPKVAPEMDAVADEFFKVFLDAGLRTGVCIRPSSIVFKDPQDPAKYPWIKGRYGHLDNDDPAGVLIDKVSYAKKRWGCTIFYMDTNYTPLRVNGQMVRKPGGAPEFRMLSSDEIRALHQKHPDVLVFPEFQQHGYFASSSGYGEYHSVGDFSAEARKEYPKAFRVWMPRLMPDDVYARWDDFLERGIRAGEVFLFECAPSRDGFGPLLKNAHADARSEWAAPAELPALLDALAKSTDWPERRRAIEALGKHADASATAALLPIMKTSTDGLELFAGRALGRQGTPAAMDALKATVAGKGRPAVAAAVGLGASGRAEAVKPLLDVLKSSREPDVRWAAIDALGELKSAEATGALCDLLKSLQGTPAERSRQKTVAALAAIGDQRAVEPLVEALGHESYAKLRPQIASALQRITGAVDTPNPQNPESWRRWLTRPAGPKTEASPMQIIAPRTEQYPRHSGPAAIELTPGGRILLAYARYSGQGQDGDPCRLVMMHSDDGGRTWSDARELPTGVARMNVFGPGFVKVGDRLHLYFCFRNAGNDSAIKVIQTADGGATWTEPRNVTPPSQTSFTMCNDRAVMLKDGRIVLAFHTLSGRPDPAKDLGTVVAYSDDQGRTWGFAPKMEFTRDPAVRGYAYAAVLPHQSDDRAATLPFKLHEPTVAELSDGSLLMLTRSTRGRYFTARSRDGGTNWSQLVPSEIKAQTAPPYLKRLRDGRLMLIWNPPTPEQEAKNHYPTSKRPTLQVAFSGDDGKTWGPPTVIGHDGGVHGFCYPAALELARTGEILVFFSRTPEIMYPCDLVCVRLPGGKT